MNHITINREGQAGYITLNRPEALNSLTHEMIHDIHAGLRTHEADENVDVIVLRSSSERAFCAGGDMKATRLLALEKKWPELQHFFEKEYALNLAIARCSKPYISLVNGIAMGGGLGLSVHGSVLVVSETSRLAMPETAIGFFPDVGGTYFLSRLPYNAGLPLALSGIPVNGKEAVTIGLASHFVADAYWPELMEALERDGRQAITSTLETLSEADSKEVLDKFQQRQSWFNSNSHDDMLATLHTAATDNEDASKLLRRIELMSPYAMNLTRQLLAEANNHDLEACLKLELKAADEAVRHPDFVEGIRAVLVDKDKANWIES